MKPLEGTRDPNTRELPHSPDCLAVFFTREKKKLHVFFSCFLKITVILHLSSSAEHRQHD